MVKFMEVPIGGVFYDDEGIKQFFQKISDTSALYLEGERGSRKDIAYFGALENVILKDENYKAPFSKGDA